MNVVQKTLSVSLLLFRENLIDYTQRNTNAPTLMAIHIRIHGVFFVFFGIPTAKRMAHCFANKYINNRAAKIQFAV